MLKKCGICGKANEHGAYNSTTCLKCLEKGLKMCSTCSTVKPLSDFSKKGLYTNSNCKSCENKRINEYKAAKYASDDMYRAAEIVRVRNRKTEISTLKPSEWLKVCELFNLQCAYCGSSSKLTMDHIIPVSKKGGTEVGNVIPACHSCNSSKGARDIVEWYTSQPFYSKRKLEAILKYSHKE